MEKMPFLKKLLNKYVELNKHIVNEYSIASVPAKRLANIPVNDLDIEEDFIYFCFTKNTKTLVAIQNLISNVVIIK